MTRRKSAAVHALIRAAILSGFAMYIVLLVKNGHTGYYIAPRMEAGVKWAAIGLYAVAVVQMFRAAALWFGKTAECGCGHEHACDDHNQTHDGQGHDHDHHELSGSPFKHAAIYALFLVPLLLGYALPDTALGSALAAKKGMNLNSAAAAIGAETPAARPVQTDSRTPAADPAAPLTVENPMDAQASADKYQLPYAKYADELLRQNAIAVNDGLYIETLATLQMYLDRFVGKKIELAGFVYRDDPAGAKQFIAGRFAVQCCSADASPYGVLVDFDKAGVLKDDTWVKVSGTVAKTNYNGTDLLSVKATSVDRIPAPQSAYVYPNDKFGK